MYLWPYNDCCPFLLPKFHSFLSFHLLSLTVAMSAPSCRFFLEYLYICFLGGTIEICEPGSSVGIATDYGLDGPGIESRCGRDFPPVQTGPGAHPASCKMGTGSFPGVKCGRGVTLTTHPLPAPMSWKNRAIPLPTLWATTGPVTGTLYRYSFFNFGARCGGWYPGRFTPVKDPVPI